MGYFRFHRSFKVMPGVRVNLAKTGPSLSLGVPGSMLNIRADGMRATVGIPGSGLSYIERTSFNNWVINKVDHTGCFADEVCDPQSAKMPTSLIDRALDELTRNQKADIIRSSLEQSSLRSAKQQFEQFEAALQLTPPVTAEELADTETVRHIYAAVIIAKEDKLHVNNMVTLIFVVSLLVVLNLAYFFQ
jgi:hypothetical protein